MTLKFTTSKVLKLEKPDRGMNQVFYWDLDIAGLSVRVTQNKNRSYIFQSRVINLSADGKSSSLEEHFDIGYLKLSL